MKMKNIILVLYVLLFVGCKKEAGNDSDKTAPLIVFASPSNNQLFVGNEAVNIDASISDDSKITEIHLEILNKTTNVLYTHEHFVPDGNTYNLKSSFVIPPATAFEIKIEAVDKNGNNAEATVNVSAD